MPVIAVVNRKGGSGKSTLSTHLAAWLARQGIAVMLGDVDRQQSTRAWLKRRPAELPAIAPWTIDQKNVLKAPPGVTHVVLDTPGGMHGFELARVVMSADAIVVPVCNSMFDRESAASCLTELAAMPRVASGRCKLGVVGMRLDARTKGAETLREWAHALDVPFLGVLRETQGYVRSLENGQTIFDLPPSTQKTDLAQWEPILEWLQPLTKVGMAAKTEVAANPAPAAAKTSNIQSSRVPSLMPAQEALVHGNRLSVFTPGNKETAGKPLGLDLVNHVPQHSASVPQFLLRH
jgi:chromosome partitioning protein